MFQMKRLTRDWATDMLDGHTRSLDGCHYAQVSANKNYLAKIYPMDSKVKAGDALKTFCREFSVPDALTSDGSKEQAGKNTEFIKHAHKCSVNHNIIEPDLHDQNPAEGVARELRRKWHRAMIRKRVPTRLWDYGMRWASDIVSLTRASAGDINGCVPLARVTGLGYYELVKALCMHAIYDSLCLVSSFADDSIIESKDFDEAMERSYYYDTIMSRKDLHLSWTRVWFRRG